MAVLYSFLLLLLRKRTKKKNKRIKDFQNEYLSISSVLFFAKQKQEKTPSIDFFQICSAREEKVTPSIEKQKKRNIVSYRGLGLWFMVFAI